VTDDQTFCFPAITEDEFYSLSHPVTSSKPSSPESSTVEADLRPSASSPPSPRSLQPNITYAAETDPNYNPHKKLTHVSSLSAPEVNQVNNRTPFNNRCMTIYNLSHPGHQRSQFPSINGTGGYSLSLLPVLGP